MRPHTKRHFDIRRPTLVGLACAFAACGSERVDAPPPATVEEEAPDTATYALPPSQVTAPVVLDLRPLLSELEQTVPVRVGSLEEERRIKVKDGTPTIWVAATLERGPLDLTFKDNTVTVSTVFQYQGKVWVKGLVATHSVSCGTGDERPRIRLTLTTSYDLTPDWRIRTSTRLVGLEPVTRTERDQCEVSFIHYDATDHVVDIASNALDGLLEKADAKLSTISLAKPIGGIWAELQKPLSIEKGTLWFLIQPQAISLGGITASDSTLTARLTLLASPRMASGPRPTLELKPLPPLGRGAGGTDTALVLIEGTLLYPAANRLLERTVVGKSFRVGFRTIKVEHVTALPGGKGRLVLAVGLKGKAKGTVYVVGTPAYDPETDLITIPDLEFDVNTSTALGRTVGWLIEGPLLGLIQRHAEIPASELMALAVEAANKEVNRELTEGVYLRGNLGEARTLGVRATSQGLTAQARGNGRLWLEISKENLLPDLPKPKGPAGS